MSMFKRIAVTNRHLCRGTLIDQIEKIAIENKPDILLVREKDLMEEEYETLFLDIMKVCNHYRIDVVLHSFLSLAIRIQWKKIHLSFHSLQENKDNLAFFEEVGVSVHSIREAIWAEQNGATYLIAGHIFETNCKRGVPPRGISFLTELCNAVTIPVYAIGGINKDNEALIRAAGADGVCIMSGYMKI